MKTTKYTTHILIFLSVFCISRAQVFDNTLPSARSQSPSPNGYTPFSGNNRPILRGIDPGDTGDPITGTGGNDGTGNVNDNNVPIGDGAPWVALLALGYMIKMIKKHRFTSIIDTKQEI